ncbi:MAG TPA: DUF2321 domain-containing protein [Gemmataceae bacterium]|nr:DUF2321 domain-containing protein [Gemmataceae bacterium]
MTNTTTAPRDAMLVCANGHVITDRLRARPDLRLARCDRCGAATVDRCRTCGYELPGAGSVPGYETVGASRPPDACPGCGAAFPWARADRPPGEDAIDRLDALLRRLPRVARELGRQRNPLSVRDDRDLDDLVRALLPVAFDDVRPEARTPLYARTTRTALYLADEGVVVVAHLVRPGVTEADLAARWEADVSEYTARGRAVVFFVHDPERRLPDPERLEATWSRETEGPEVYCVIAT